MRARHRPTTGSCRQGLQIARRQWPRVRNGTTPPHPPQMNFVHFCARVGWWDGGMVGWSDRWCGGVNAGMVRQSDESVSRSVSQSGRGGTSETHVANTQGGAGTGAGDVPL